MRIELWWTTQMRRVYGRRPDEADYYPITMNEDHGSFPEYEEDPLMFEDVEEWVAQKLLQKKYPPAQVAMIWR
jgi:hypothetical protein